MIRHHTALNSDAPAFERLWMFWHNHFANAEKDMLDCWNTGAYTREVIRPNMFHSSTDLVKAVTTSWTMTAHLDNSQSLGPNPTRGRWWRENGKVATVNEYHARELLELHTVSPAAGYSQKDVIAMSYIMAGWENRWYEKREKCNPAHFDQKSHESGHHLVMGKRYKQRGLSAKSKLTDVIEDVCAHLSCAEFVSNKLVRHFVTDDVIPEMVQPVIETWTQSGGDLPTVHMALIRVVYEHTGKHKKFPNPEVWFLKRVKIAGVDWPPTSEEMQYGFNSRPEGTANQPKSVMYNLVYHPYKPPQPNGCPYTEAKWLSPELLIRQLAMARRMADDWIRRGMDAAELQGLAVTLPMPLLRHGSEALENYFPTYIKLPPKKDIEKINASSTSGSELDKTMQRILHRPRSMMQRASGDNEAHELANVAAEEPSREDGPRIAVFDLDDFDNHAAQGGKDGEQLNKYDRVLRVLKDKLGDEFNNTLVLTLTEFGHKFDQNCGFGTEHGYGTAILMVGGLLKKAEVHADWPGLKSKDLFEGQDLNATVDARSVYCAAMAARFDVNFGYMKRHAFWDEPLTDVTEQLFKV